MDTKKIGAQVFGELRNVMLEENGVDNMPKKVTNQEVLERIGKKTLLNNILRSKASWIGLILGINCLLHDAIEAQVKEVKRKAEEEEEHNSLMICEKEVDIVS